jgi:Uri superfamily endonuclease
MIPYPEMLAQPGTYALIFSSASDQRVEIGRLGRLDFPSGFWVYVGSAFGPGGLKARVAHHRRIAQRPRWHMDYLRPVLQLKEVWFTCDAERREHHWADALGRLRGARIPVAGFGSSDCRCKSHLFSFNARPSFRLFYDRLRSGCSLHSKNMGTILERQIIASGEMEQK